MARRRHLRPEEREIWDLVARTTRAMHPTRRAKVEDPIPKAPLVAPQAPSAGLESFRLGARAPKSAARHDLMPTPVQKLRDAPLKMDASTHKTMTRGKLMPEARLDLHGLTLAEAHPELIRFTLNAVARGLRLVLVITGKGKDRDTGGPIPMRLGALRHQVPQWLHLPPLGPVILQVTPAHLRHGGEGAYYVYLKRQR